jgi:hypothetical protein
MFSVTVKRPASFDAEGVALGWGLCLLGSAVDAVWAAVQCSHC